MIFKNKNSDKSSVFGDKPADEAQKPIDPSVLEGFFRKQTAVDHGLKKSNILTNKIARSSTSGDDRNSGEIFLGKRSSRSLFNPNSISEESVIENVAKKSNKFLPNVKSEISDDIANDLLKFKNNFNNASKMAGSHGSVRKDRVSIFDSDPFERISEKKEEIKEEVEEESKISKSLSSKDISSSLFEKLNDNNISKSKTSRQKSLDKLFGVDDE